MSDTEYRAEQIAVVAREMARLDLVNVVRCRDCKYGDEVVWPKSWNVPDDYLDCTGPLVTTWDYYNDEPKSNPVPPDGFCAWGERRTNDN